MTIAEAIVEYLRLEVVPGIAGKSELTAAILNGALRAGRKRVAEKISNLEILKSFGVTDEQGNADPEVAADFADGFFEGREKVSFSLAQILKALTGIESTSPLLQDKLTFTKKDAETFIELLKKSNI